VEGLAMEDVGLFYSYLVYFTVIYFVVILVYFPSFGMLYQEKSGNPPYRFLFSSTGI
jgi:hypothetical protein